MSWISFKNGILGLWIKHIQLCVNIIHIGQVKKFVSVTYRAHTTRWHIKHRLIYICICVCIGIYFGQEYVCLSMYVHILINLYTVYIGTPSLQLSHLPRYLVNQAIWANYLEWGKLSAIQFCSGKFSSELDQFRWEKLFFRTHFVSGFCYSFVRISHLTHSSQDLSLLQVSLVEQCSSKYELADQFKQFILAGVSCMISSV